MAAERVYVVGSIQLGVVDAADVLASRLVTPCEAVPDDDDALHMLEDDRNALDVVPASCRMAVDVLFPLMIPCQSAIGDGDARLGEDDESDILPVIVVLIAVVVLLLVEDDLDT